MNTRTLLITTALLLPLVAIIIIASSAPELPVASAPKGEALVPGGASVAPNRLPPTAGKARPRKKAPPQPLSLEEARSRVKEELERLKRLSPEEWEAEQRQRIASGQPLPPRPGEDGAADNEPAQELPAPQRDD